MQPRGSGHSNNAAAHVQPQPAEQGSWARAAGASRGQSARPRAAQSCSASVGATSNQQAWRGQQEGRREKNPPHGCPLSSCTARGAPPAPAGQSSCTQQRRAAGPERGSGAAAPLRNRLGRRSGGERQAARACSPPAAGGKPRGSHQTLHYLRQAQDGAGVPLTGPTGWRSPAHLQGQQAGSVGGTTQMQHGRATAAGKQQVKWPGNVRPPRSAAGCV